MNVCPVCEHPQPSGDTCEVCGRRLAGGAAAAPPIAPVEGLEPTHHLPADVIEEGVPDLEPTAHGAVDVEELPAVELEPTATAAVDVAVDDTPDLERIGDDIPGDAPTEVPSLVTCRYCRTPALPGERVCARCGMRLPVFGTGPAPAVVPERMCGCGVPVRGPVCPSCGARNAGG